MSSEATVNFRKGWLGLGDLRDERVAIAPLVVAYFIAALLCRLLPGASLFIYAWLIGLSLRSSRGAIQALLFSVIMGYLDPVLFKTTSFDGYMRYLVVFVSFGMELLRTILTRRRFPSSVLYIVGFYFVAAACSLLGRMPLISMMKLTSWFIGVVALFLAYSNDNSTGSYWMKWFSSLFFAIVLTGIPLYFTGVGRMPETSLYEGIFCHPQAYAAILTPAVAWFTALFISSKRRKALLAAIVFAGWALLIATHARTAIVAIGCSAVFVMFFSSHRIQLIRIFFGNVFGPIVLVLSMVFGYLYVDTVRSEIAQFITKGNPSIDIEEAFMQSRGAGIVMSLKNFIRSPATGIGFGVPSHPRLSYIGTDTVFGLPMSAPVEKGFLPSAVLEEIGVFGTSAFIALLLRILFSALKEDELPKLFLLIATLSVNLGEYAIFSIGGLGLYSWGIIGFTLGSSNFFPKPKSRPGES